GVVSNYPMCSYFSWWSSSHSPCIHSCVANCDEWRSSQLISFADSLWRTSHEWLASLSEYPGDMVRPVRCGRTGQYRKQTLIERYGADIRLPDLRGKSQSVSVRAKCMTPAWCITLSWLRR